MAQFSGGGESAGSYVPPGDRAATMGGGGRFRIEPSGVRKFADGIDDEISQLDVILGRTNTVSQVSPPGGDPSSAEATDDFGKTADGRPVALLAAHKGFREIPFKTKNTILQNAAAAGTHDVGTPSSLGFGS